MLLAAIPGPSSERDKEYSEGLESVATLKNLSNIILVMAERR